MQKLIPRIEGGGGGGCPILVFGISPKLYVEDMKVAATADDSLKDDDNDAE